VSSRRAAAAAPLSLPLQVVRAAQSAAGNGEVSRALTKWARQGADEDERPDPEPAEVRHAPHVGPIAVSLVLPQGALDGVVAGRRIRSARGLPAALVGRRGTVRGDWRDATGALAVQQAVGYRCGRVSSVLHGRLRGFRGVRLSKPFGQDGGQGAFSTGIDLHRVDPVLLRRTGRVLVQLGNEDLVRARVPVEVTLDGLGGISLAFRFRRGGLVMKGRRNPARGGDGLDWVFALQLPTATLGTAVWRGLPRRQRLGAAPARLVTAADPPEDEAPPELDPPAAGAGPPPPEEPPPA
jgi:hypothetical protein